MSSEMKRLRELEDENNGLKRIVRCRADQHDNAMLPVFEACFEVDAIRPDVDVAPG